MELSSRALYPEHGTLSPQHQETSKKTETHIWTQVMASPISWGHGISILFTGV